MSSEYPNQEKETSLEITEESVSQKLEQIKQDLTFIKQKQQIGCLGSVLQILIRAEIRLLEEDINTLTGHTAFIIDIIDTPGISQPTNIKAISLLGQIYSFMGEYDNTGISPAF